MVTVGEVRDLLDERPDLEPTVEAVLEPDEPWTFDDVDADSGRFGELVSRGVVEKTDDGYRVPDRDALERAVNGEVAGEPDTGVDVDPDFEFALPEVDRLEAGLFLGALALVVAFRLFSLPQVFQGEHVVLSSNDPYAYRFLVDQLLLDPDTTLSTLPRSARLSEPLLVASLWLVSLVFGGTQTAAGWVMAWYPVVSAVLTAVFVYVLAVVVTEDRRIALAAVALLAVLPGHAFRTSLGFADHHPFDYLWVSLTALAIPAIVWACREWEFPSRRTLVPVVGLGIGVGAQTLAWDASPLVLAPLGFYLLFEALRAVHTGESPLDSATPVLAGTAVGAVIAWLGHLVLGWHTTLVASAPTLVLVGGAGAVGLAELAHRRGFSARGLVGAEALAAVVGAFLFSVVFPGYWGRLVDGVNDRLLASRGIAETQSLFGSSWAWLLLFGFILVLGLPYMAWSVRRSLDDSRWLAPTVYGWYFFVLSTIQIRFVGELAPVLALFAGLGFVHVAERVDLARRPAPFADGDPPELSLPDVRTAGLVVVLFLLISGLSMAQVPVKTSQITVPDGQYETAAFMAEYSDEHDMTYPDNYVLSPWWKNRMYNYFVNGQSRGYGYARNTYNTFLRSAAPEEWYNRLSGRVGFVVTRPFVVQSGAPMGVALHRENGNRLARYRLVYDNGNRKVFTLVPGALIEGTAAANASVTARTQVEVPGESFTYTREGRTNATGHFAIRVAHPGQYQVGNTTVTVPESAVRNGTVVRATNGTG